MNETQTDIQKKEADTPQQGEHTRQQRVFTPLVDIIEKKDDIVVLADMPGVDERSVDVTLEKNVLTIYGQVEANIPQNHRLYMSEYGVGDYHRVFNLTNEIDRDKIQATVQNGVLKLILPKAETVKTKKITVKAN